MTNISGWSWGLPVRIGGGDRQEGARVIWLFTYFFCIVAASTIGRTAADTLFLSRFGSSQLSMMYLPQAASLIFTGFLLQRYASRIRLDRLIVMLIPALSLAVIASRIGVSFNFTWVYPVMYVGYDVINFLMIVCFWQFASSVLDQRKAKRTIPLVGSGGIIGGIVSGFGLKLLAPLVGTANLIFFYAGLQLLALLIVIQLVRMCANPAETFGNPQKSGKIKQDKRTGETDKGLFQNVPHLKYIALLSGALVISLTFVDYQFKVILKDTLQNDALAGFMGSFYGFSGLCALLVQLFIAGKLISRFGVMTSILVFPLALLTGSIGVLMMPVLAMALLAKGSDKVIGDTIYSSVNQLIMFPISPRWRNRAKSFLDGIIRNGAKGVAAISLIILSPLLSIQQFSYVIIGMLGIGIYAAIRVKSVYLQMLLSTLISRDTDTEGASLDLMDPASRQLLTKALHSNDGQQALYALRILGSLGEFNLAPYIPALLRHSFAEVGEEALRYVERTTPLGMEQEIMRLLNEGADHRVMAQALIALAAYGQELYLEPLSEWLEADEVDIRAGAIAGLIKYYGIEGMFRAVGTLKALIESGQDDERTAMASLFGRIGIREFYKPLIPLIQDPFSDVRRCALQSAEKLVVPQLVPYIVPLLQESQTRREAIEALAAYEEKIILPLLEPYLAGNAASLHAPKVFERIGSQLAFHMLLRHYSTALYDMKDKLLEAMIGMDREKLLIDTKEVERLTLQELERYGKFAEHMNWMPYQVGEADIKETVEAIRASMIRRVFHLLGFIYDEHTMDAVYDGWLNGDVRQQANAAEVIDQLIHGELRTELTQWMLAPRSVVGEPGRTLQSEQLMWLFDHGDETLQEVIRYTVMESGESQLMTQMQTRCNPSDTADDQMLRERMKRMQMLKGVALFEGFKGKDLLSIVRILHEVEVPQGELVFQEKALGDSLYLVREGRAGVYRGDMRIDERGAGDHFGQTAVLTRRLRTATIRAETDLRLLRLDSSDFYETMFERTELAMEMMRWLSRKLRTSMGNQGQVANGSLEASSLKVAAAIDTTEPLVPQKSKELEPEQIHNQTILRRVLVLQKIELFAHLSQDDFVRLAHRVEEVIYEPGEIICRLNEHGDTMFGIIEGSIRVHRGDDTLAVLGVGQCFGEMAIIDSGPRSADCTAVEHTVLLRLGRHQVFSFCFQQIDALKGMMKVLADRLREIPSQA
jgi:CRP-like cAMP-binding protein/ATP/ADP translocase/HEAT repeat protein